MNMAKNLHYYCNNSSRKRCYSDIDLVDISTYVLRDDNVFLNNLSILIVIGSRSI